MKKRIKLQYGKFLTLHANKSKVLCNSMVSAEKGLGEEREHGDKKDCAQHQTDSQYSRGRGWGRGRASMGTRGTALITKQTVSAAGKGLGGEEEHGDKMDCLILLCFNLFPTP